MAFNLLFSLSNPRNSNLLKTVMLFYWIERFIYAAIYELSALLLSINSAILANSIQRKYFNQNN